MAVSTLKKKVHNDILIKAYDLMCQAREMAAIYEENKQFTSKYVHATSRGHEAIQLAASLQLLPQDFIFPYYRDDSILLGIGYTPFELMLQLMAKATDPFSGGRTYYSHPSSDREDMPKIPHQSSATGMQAIPATGLAHGIAYLEEQELLHSEKGEAPVVVCSLGDASVTEGEVAEAFQMAVLKQLPIVYLIQDNEWDISATAKETRAQNAAYYARGFKGLKVKSVDGSDFTASYEVMNEVLNDVRKSRRPYLIHATVPLLNHHTSGVRSEWYRDDLEEHWERDPFPVLEQQLKDAGFSQSELDSRKAEAKEIVQADYNRAIEEPDPQPEDLTKHIFKPTPITEEKGERHPADGETVVMVDAALHAVERNSAHASGKSGSTDRTSVENSVVFSVKPLCWRKNTAMPACSTHRSRKHISSEVPLACRLPVVSRSSKCSSPITSGRDLISSLPKSAGVIIYRTASGPFNPLSAFRLVRTVAADLIILLRSKLLCFRSKA